MKQEWNYRYTEFFLFYILVLALLTWKVLVDPNDYSRLISMSAQLTPSNLYSVSRDGYRK